MANVLFYSTGEIFWVTDPPPGRPAIGISNVMPDVPPDHLFTYAMAAHALEDVGHRVIGAFGRQRAEVRERNEANQYNGAADPELLGLATLSDPHATVLVVLATDSGDRSQGGVDQYKRNPITSEERAAVDAFRKAGGGVYVCWDHGPLGYRSLEELGLADPIEYPGDFRPNVVNSYDSTDSGEIEVDGHRKDGDNWVEARLRISVGPPAGYLQKIAPASSLRGGRTGADPRPHPIFNGVGGEDGIWIPAHMHEGRLKVSASLQQGIHDNNLPENVHVLAVHIPFTDTIFQSFAVMATKDSTWAKCDGEQKITDGRVLWDTSFHHLVDINWVSDGEVAWEHFTPFSVEGLWRQQLPQQLFERRLNEGMKRLFANAVAWLAHELPGAPSRRVSMSKV